MAPSAAEAEVGDYLAEVGAEVLADQAAEGALTAQIQAAALGIVPQDRAAARSTEAAASVPNRIRAAQAPCRATHTAGVPTLLTTMADMATTGITHPGTTGCRFTRRSTTAHHTWAEMGTTIPEDLASCVCSRLW